MSDFFGGMTTPFLAAFDPDGSKTDQLVGRGRSGPELGDDGGGDPEETWEGARRPRRRRGYGAPSGGHRFSLDLNDPKVCRRCGRPRRDHEEDGQGGGGSQDPDDQDFSDNPNGWRYTESENGVRYSHVPPGRGTQ